MALGYEDARAVCEAAPDGEFSLPDYTGSPTDSDYLKNYVLSAVTSIYNVTADIFDTATVYSTTILRDFVHRAIYQNTDHEYIDDVAARGGLIAPQTEDVATALRYPAWGACGLLAWQEYQVFDAFGYRTKLLSFINGDFGTGDTESFSDGHASTEVFCEDIGKSIIQDATFNFIYEDANGNMLSWLEAREAATDGTLHFDNFDVYTYYRSAHVPQTGAFPANLEDIFLENYFKVPQMWASNGEEPGTGGSLYALFPNWTTAHTDGAYQGETYASVDAAWSDIQALVDEGWNWSRIANALNDTHYVSGFRVGNTEWLTVRLSTYDYVSIEIHSGQVLNGSFDQLMNDATGNDRNLNPGVDLSFMLQPPDFLSWKGIVMNDWVDKPALPATVTLRDTDTGALKLWSLDEPVDAATSFGSPDKSFTLVDRADYDGDGKSDLLFFHEKTGLVGYWDEGQGWHRLNALTPAWEEQAHSGTSDFFGDGADDILWRNTITGQVVAWNMFNGEQSGYKSYGNVGLDWSIIGTADFNGDNIDDILWRNANSGELREWIMQDGAVAKNLGIDRVGSTWTVLGVGDFTNDGSADILWRNSSTLEVATWDIDGGQKGAFRHLDFISSSWNVATIADVTGDGTDDIVWQSATGSIVTWQMHDGLQTATAQGATDWHIV